MVKLIQEINQKRQSLDDGVRELASIEESIESIRAMNKDMRTDQFDQEKRIKIIQANALDLQSTKTQLDTDYEAVKQRLADKET